MKLIRNIILSFILMFTMTSCEDWFYIDHIGKPVEFGITTGKSIKTRTVYAGIENGKEILQWSNNDEVTIWMYWDRDADEYCEATTDPVTYGVKLKENIGYKSYGSLVSLGESLRWQPDRNGDECIHEFYSIYPANKAAVNGNIATFSIPNSQSGVDMSLAYMTAHRRVEIEDNGTVELEYYPRVTTLYIAVVNDTDETINGGEIKLTSSDDNPISGNYTVNILDSYGELAGNNDGKEITNSIKNLNKGDSDTVAFFIRPRQYASDELSLTFNGSENVLAYDNGFSPNKKYNIRIKASNQKQPDIKEPVPVPPIISDLDPVMAQIILCYFRKLDNSGYSQFESFWKTYFDYTDKTSQGGKTGSNYFDEGWYQQLQNKINNARDWVGFIKELFNVPPAVKEGALDALLKEIWNSEITEVSINDGSYKLANGFTNDTQLSKFFPNLQSLKLQIDGKKGFVIYLTDFDSLNVEIGGNNGSITIYVAKGSNITVTNTDSNTITIVEVEVNET